MRLDEFDPNAINVDDQRGQGGGGFQFPMGGGGGRIGCGTMIIVIIAALVFKVDPSQLLGGMQGGPMPGQEQAQVQSGSSTAESCKIDKASLESCNALYSLNQTWAPLFKAANIEFAAYAAFLFPAGPIRLRRSAERDGAILLPHRSRYLSRY